MISESLVVSPLPPRTIRSRRRARIAGLTGFKVMYIPVAAWMLSSSPMRLHELSK